MTADELNDPCRHGDSIVTCPDCLNDEIEATVLLAGLDSSPGCICPPDECHEAGAPGCYFGENGGDQ